MGVEILDVVEHGSCGCDLGVVGPGRHQSLGAILVVAMLIVPATSGYLLARSMFGMILIACLFSILSATGGVIGSAALDASPGAAIAIAAGVLLSLVVLVDFRRPGIFLESSED